MSRFTLRRTLVAVLAVVFGVGAFFVPTLNAGATGSGGGDPDCVITQFKYKKSVEDSKLKYQYQKQVKGEVRERLKGGSSNLVGTFDWEFFQPPTWKGGPLTQWSFDDVAVLESGPHNATSNDYLQGEDMLFKKSTHYQYVRVGEPVSVPNGSHYEYYLPGGGSSLTNTDANWTTETPGEPWVKFDERQVVSDAPGCNTSEEKITFCHLNQGNGYNLLTTSKAAFYVGHREHSGDIYPAGSYKQGGQSFSWPAQGDQSLLETGCQPKPDPKVTHKVDDKTNCDGVFHREWDLVSYPVWNADKQKWEYGEPVVENDTDWVKVRDLTEEELYQYDCVKPYPDVDIEKWSTSDGMVAGDFDESAKGLNPTGDEAITFTVTNSGDEKLVNVSVSDETTAGTGTLTGVSCDFSVLGGPATGTSWSGPFLVGDSFPCTGTLPALGYDATHTDVATVTAEGKYSGTTVTDNDPWNGTTPKAESAEPTVVVTAEGCVNVNETTAASGVITNTDDDTNEAVSYDWVVTVSGSDTVVDQGTVENVADNSSAPFAPEVGPGDYTVTITGSDGTTTSTEFSVEQCQITEQPADFSVASSCGKVSVTNLGDVDLTVEFAADERGESFASKPLPAGQTVTIKTDLKRVAVSVYGEEDGVSYVGYASVKVKQNCGGHHNPPNDNPPTYVPPATGADGHEPQLDRSDRSGHARSGCDGCAVLRHPSLRASLINPSPAPS